MHDLSDFCIAYLTAALWSSTDNSDDSGGIPLEQALEISLDHAPDVIGALAPEAIERAKADCAKFQEDNAEDLQLAYDTEGYGGEEQAGHDFWLTRNGHGVGFWDRGIGEIGERLSDASRKFGECDCYIGDDKKVYFG